jgi:hypothetical protein
VSVQDAVNTDSAGCCVGLCAQALPGCFDHTQLHDGQAACDARLSSKPQTEARQAMSVAAQQSMKAKFLERMSLLHVLVTSMQAYVTLNTAVCRLRSCHYVQTSTCSQKARWCT